MLEKQGKLFLGRKNKQCMDTLLAKFLCEGTNSNNVVQKEIPKWIN